MTTTKIIQGNILVVDQQGETVKGIKDILASECFRVICAQFTQNVKAVLQREQVDIVILFALGSNNNVLDFIQEVRLINPSIAFIIISQDDLPDVILNSLQCGANITLLKPYQPEEVLRVVNALMQKMSLSRESVRLKTLMPFFEINKSILANVHEDKVFNRIMRTICVETKADKVSLMLLDELSNELVVKAAFGLSKSMIHRSLALPNDKISWSVLKTGKAILINAKPNKEYLTEHKPSLITSVLCVPLVIKNKAIGVINCSKNNSKPPFGSGDLELLTILAAQAAIAAENIRLFQDNKAHKVNIEVFLRKCLTAQEDERRRISTELHDGLAQWLVSASYFIQLCNGYLSASKMEEAQDSMHRAAEVLNGSIKELRRVILDLHPRVLAEFGLIDSIQQQLDSLSKDTGISTSFDINGHPCLLSAMQDRVLYRFCLEALSNVRKHSTASKVEVVLGFTQEEVSLGIVDNGHGFDLNKVMNSEIQDGHIGLLSMKEKAGMVGGRMNITTVPGNGTEVFLIMPHSADGKSHKQTIESREPETIAV